MSLSEMLLQIDLISFYSCVFLRSSEKEASMSYVDFQIA